MRDIVLIINLFAVLLFSGTLFYFRHGLMILLGFRIRCKYCDRSFKKDGFFLPYETRKCGICILKDHHSIESSPLNVKPETNTAPEIDGSNQKSYAFQKFSGCKKMTLYPEWSGSLLPIIGFVGGYFILLRWALKNDDRQFFDISFLIILILWTLSVIRVVTLKIDDRIHVVRFPIPSFKSIPIKDVYDLFITKEDMTSYGYVGGPRLSYFRFLCSVLNDGSLVKIYHSFDYSRLCRIRSALLSEVRNSRNLNSL